MDMIMRRWAQQLLDNALAVMPVVVVTGARQTGKTTLVRDLISDNLRRFITLDDLSLLDQAKNDPLSLIAEKPVTIDEVQRAPDFLITVKQIVDQNRQKGSILLTGSANLLLMNSISESLAGRAYYLHLPPFCSLEWVGKTHIDHFIDSLFCEQFDIKAWDSSPGDWKSWTIRGGLPPVLQLENDAERSIWLSGYIQTYIERDLRQLANISNLIDFQRIMRLATNRVGRLLNQSDIARDAAIPQATCHRYLNLLETGYQITRIPTYSTNASSPVIKAKKLFFNDSAIGCFLAGIDNVSCIGTRQDRGFWFEQAFFQILQSWKALDPVKRHLYFWRDRQGHEVDFICEINDSIIAIEIKSGSTVTEQDFNGIEAFKSALGKSQKRLKRSIIFHTGDTLISKSNGDLVLPIGCFFPPIPDYNNRNSDSD